MIQRLRRILIGVGIGLVIFATTIWVLIHTLGARELLYQGKSAFDWVQLMNSPVPAVSNEAQVVIQTAVIPKLTYVMFHDMRDSGLRMLLIDELNTLPGINIYYVPAAGRRSQAASDLGMFGPQARIAIPDLVQALKGKDPAVRPSAARSLGAIHGQPETTIPLLITCIDDRQEDVPEAAIDALGDFGPLSRPAVPKLIPLLKVPDKDLQRALRTALKLIDPEAAAQAGVK